MRKMMKTITALFLITGLASCGINQSWILNQNQNATQVQLKENNFKVVEQVRGSAEVKYVLIFGGVKRKRLYDEAYAEMQENAKLVGESRVVTNVLTEEHIGGFPPFFYRRTISVSGNVIEFTE